MGDRLQIVLRCSRSGCGTQVRMAGKLDDPIMRQVSCWGSSCPKCGDDLNVEARLKIPDYSEPRRSAK